MQRINNLYRTVYNLANVEIADKKQENAKMVDMELTNMMRITMKKIVNYQID